MVYKIDGTTSCLVQLDEVFPDARWYSKEYIEAFKRMYESCRPSNIVDFFNDIVVYGT